MSFNQTERLFLAKIGRRIRILRQDKGWSQEKLALQSGLHRTYVGAVERGERNISAINLLKIALAIGIDISDLFMNLEEE